MTYRLFLLCILSLCLCGESLRANPPVASYIFPAGGQRGTKVEVRVGGLFLHQACGFEMLGQGVETSKELKRTRTPWFEGPVLPLPDSQQAEDYPKDMTGSIQLAPNAELGLRRARLWTAEGAASGLLFMVGDLPEIVENDVVGDPVPAEVKLPVTINGRIFPRQNVDVWTVTLKKGQTLSCEVYASRLGSPLDSLLEIVDPNGRVIADNDDTFGADSFVRFTAAQDGKYQVRLRDANFKGGQAYVYRLTLTTAPVLDRSYPLGAKRGSRTRFQLSGPGMPAEPVEIEIPQEAPRSFVYRHRSGPTLSNPIMLDVDELPEYVAHEAPVMLPCLANGRIDKAGAVDQWRFTAKKGEPLLFELRAAQLGSPLQGVLTVRDASGKELSRAEATGTQLDPSLTFTAPADGEYTVGVAERFRQRGGPAFAYRLRLAPPPAPGFRLQIVADARLQVAPDALTLPRGGQVKLKISAVRLGGFAGAIPLTVERLPAGVKANPATIAAKQNAVDLVLVADKTAAIDVSRLTIRGAGTQTATCGGSSGQPDTDTVLLAVALPAPFKIVGDYDMRWASRGTVYKRKYRIERNGFDGPIEISLADRQARHLQGVTGPTLTVPPGVSEFEYPVQLPPWMETGRTCRVCVQGVGVVKEGERSYTVSFSAVGQNDQMIAVVETGRLGVETEKTSLTATRGGRATLKVKVARGKDLVGPVKVELVLPEHVRGVQVEPLVIAANQIHGTLTLRFGREALGPFNMPFILRATLADTTGPIVAETKIELILDN